MARTASTGRPGEEAARMLKQHRTGAARDQAATPPPIAEDKADDAPAPLRVTSRRAGVTGPRAPTLYRSSSGRYFPDFRAAMA